MRIERRATKGGKTAYVIRRGLRKQNSALEIPAKKRNKWSMGGGVLGSHEIPIIRPNCEKTSRRECSGTGKGSKKIFIRWLSTAALKTKLKIREVKNKGCENPPG